MFVGEVVNGVFVIYDIVKELDMVVMNVLGMFLGVGVVVKVVRNERGIGKVVIS